MLTILGSGIGGWKSLSREAEEALVASDLVFAEDYTSRFGEPLEVLQRRLGIEIRVLERREVEEGEEILERARTKNVTFLCPGDPLTATTHQELRIRAVREGIRVVLLPSSSIVTMAPALVGLHISKFGRMTTLAFPEGEYFPLSPFEVIEENLERHLHTLVLLDLQAQEGRFMSASEGARVLLEAIRRKGSSLLSRDSLLLAIARAGDPSALLVRGTVEEIASVDLGPPLHTLIVPGPLHFKEEEALELFTLPSSDLPLISRA